jgi:large-conductance mechanosensitive channel
MYLVIKGMNRMRRMSDIGPNKEPSKEELLLTEIRDLLKNKSSH